MASEAMVIRTVRIQVAERDGYCRVARLLVGWFGRCSGPSQWAHFGPFKRWQTRNQKPEDRHCTKGSLMLCQRHHALYDKRILGLETEWLEIEALSPELCDGPLAFLQNGHRIEEAA